jgi:uncharacterized RDD family membrane protein YckC
MGAPEESGPGEDSTRQPGRKVPVSDVRQSIFGEGGPLPPAFLGHRFIAFSLDTLLVGAFLGLVLFRVVLPEFYPVEFQELKDWYATTSMELASGGTPLQPVSPDSVPERVWELLLFIQNFIVFGFWLYFGVCETFFQGKTLGKRVFRLKVISIRNLGPLNLGSAIVRSLMKTLCLFTLFPLLLVNFLSVFFFKYRRAGHDLLSQSLVIEDNMEIHTEEAP